MSAEPMPNDFNNMLSRCCDLFRMGRHAEASVVLEQWLGHWAQMTTSNPKLMSEAACHSLSVALDCQERHDWIGLADELEFVLLPCV